MRDGIRIKWRSWLILGRVSNLPTVWSNCLCGWLLGGGGPIGSLLWLCLGGTLLYVGGMFWNDAFDADFDRQHRRERPIPSGQLMESGVWWVGGVLLGLGFLVLASLGWSTAVLALLLLLSIVLYDAIHKAVEFSPVIMALCRYFLMLVAASVGDIGVTGLAIWSAFALAGWVIGLSYVARRESIRGPMAWWPLTALALPMVLALLVNDGPHRIRGVMLVLLVTAWVAWCLSHSLWAGRRQFGRTVSGLLAGICLVDLLAAPPNLGTTLVFLFCFAAAVLAQRYVPAT